METGYKVIDIMTNHPVTMKSDVTVKECAQAILSESVGSVLVVENNEIKGIITEKDIVTRLVAKGLDSKKTLLKDIMTPKSDMVFIEPNKDLYDAIIIMKDNGVRRLPVLDAGKIKGLLTLNDILKIEPDLFDIMVEKLDIREEERKFGALNSDEDK